MIDVTKNEVKNFSIQPFAPLILSKKETGHK